MDPQDSRPIPPPETPKQLGNEPERYIRTFAGDIDVVQRGGTPGLSPLKTPEPVAPSVTAEVPPMAPVPTPEPTEIPTPPPAPAFRFKPPEPIAEPEQAPTPEPAPTDTSKDATPLKTYADDFRQHMNETHASTATVLAAEQDAGPHEEELAPEPTTPKSHAGWYIIASLLLVIVGGTGVFYAFSKYLTANAPIVLGPTTVAPIFVDSTASVSGTGRALMQAVVQSVRDSQPNNSVKLLSLTGTSTPNVLLSLGAPVPGILMRNITDTGNMAGVVNVNGTQSPFFIESVELYSATFSGMLTWEATMQKDLSQLYPLYPAAAAQTPSTASSTASTTPASATSTPPVVAPAPIKGGFRDETISNHDVRVYRDSQGRSILIYGYWNQKTLVIARDPAAYAEILDRLATSHTQ